VGVVAWGWLLHTQRAGPRLERTLWRDGMSFGSMSVNAELMAQAERLLIPLVLGYGSLAIYAVLAAMVMGPLRMLEMAAANTLAPRLRAANSRSARMSLLLADVVLIGIATVVIGGGLLLVGPTVFDFVLPGRHLPAGLVLAALICGLSRILVAFSQAIAAACGSEADYSRTQLLGWMGLGLSVGLGTLFASHGLEGVLYGIAMGWIFKAVTVLAVSRRHLLAEVAPAPA
jgi:hypothetical protein